jgi:hypothetical protein
MAKARALTQIKSDQGREAALNSCETADTGAAIIDDNRARIVTKKNPKLGYGLGVR